MNLHRNCDCELYRDMRAAKAQREEAIEERAELVRVVDAIACHLGVDVDAVIEDPSVAIAAHTAAIAAEREACAKIADTYSAQADKSPSDFQRGYCEACHDLAVEFRARGQEVKPCA